MENFLEFLVVSWFDPYLLFLTAVGTMAGIYVGAIPGLSVTMAASILISFTFKWDVNEALALIAGIYMGGVYGGSRTAILLNIPGAPSAIATAIEGYPMAKRGEAGEGYWPDHGHVGLWRVYRHSGVGNVCAGHFEIRNHVYFA